MYDPAGVGYMSMKATVSQTWRGQEVKIQGKKVVNKSIYEVGLIVEGQAKELAPKDTGRLAASITTQSSTEGTEPKGKGAVATDKIQKPSSDMEVLVGTATDYSIWQEFGTVRMNASPFLRPALDLAHGKVLTIVQENEKYYFKDYERRPS
jgi:HK97 gp10 family phage protein